MRGYLYVIWRELQRVELAVKQAWLETGDRAYNPCCLIDLDDIIPYSIDGQSGDRMQVKLTHEVGSVRFRRFDTEVESHSDFFGGFSLCQKLNHFSFPGRQKRSAGTILIVIVIVIVVWVQVPLHHQLRNPGGKERPPLL
jgi:hypothetical protein